MGSMLDNSIAQYLIWSLSASDRYLNSVSSCWTDVSIRFEVQNTAGLSAALNQNEPVLLYYYIS